MPSHPNSLSDYTSEAERLALALDGRRVGTHWEARCPAHDDHHPSFHITEKNGKVLFHCWAGCPQPAVIDALKDRRLWGKV
jgi:putative DNA primase/helicase